MPIEIELSQIDKKYSKSMYIKNETLRCLGAGIENKGLYIGDNCFQLRNSVIIRIPEIDCSSYKINPAKELKKCHYYNTYGGQVVVTIKEYELFPSSNSKNANIVSHERRYLSNGFPLKLEISDVFFYE